MTELEHIENITDLEAKHEELLTAFNAQIQVVNATYTGE